MSKKTTPPKALTLEDRIQEAANRDMGIKSYAIAHLPIPAKPLEVGQAVYYGNVDDAVVVAVLEEGRRVAITHTPLTPRDKPRPEGVEVKVVPSFDLQAKSAAAEDNFGSPNQYLLHYSQRDVSGLLSLVASFGVDMDPVYQRDLVWDEADKIKLIDSMFKQVDIGKFVFRKLPFASDAPSYEIVDGKQRLNAILDFMADRFPYRARTWSQLSRYDRHYIEGYSVSYAQLAESFTTQQVMETFVRLNTGGRPVDPKHLEKVAAMASQAPGRSSPKP